MLDFTRCARIPLKVFRRELSQSQSRSRMLQQVFVVSPREKAMPRIFGKHREGFPTREFVEEFKEPIPKPGPSSDEPEIIMLREFSREDYLPSEPSPLTVVSSHAGAVHREPTEAAARIVKAAVEHTIPLSLAQKGRA